jgi:DNA modification methylase
MTSTAAADLEAASTPALSQWTVEWRDPHTLKPYALNPRVNEPAIASVAHSIRTFGFRQPIVVDADDVIVVGHTRWKAALLLELPRVPVHVATDLTDAQARAYRIADNKTSELSTWHVELLAQELQGIGEDLDWTLFGFQEKDLAQLMNPQAEEGLSDPDNIPEAPAVADTKRGDLYLLGRHRLVCGDAGDPSAVDALLDGDPGVDLVYTDPPYNVNVEPRSNNAMITNAKRWGSAAKGLKKTDQATRPKDRPLMNDWVGDKAFVALLTSWCQQIGRVLRPGHTFYCWSGFMNIGAYPAAFAAGKLHPSQVIVWDKGHPVLTRSDFMFCYEMAFYGWKEGKPHRYFGPPSEKDLWQVKKVSGPQMVHLTEKPVALVHRAVTYSSRPDEIVLDLFGGSGSTLIGCHQHNRVARIMELDPTYCDVIVKRFEQFTGVKPERRRGKPAPARRTKKAAV